jgi:hypothetical protein
MKYLLHISANVGILTRTIGLALLLASLPATAQGVLTSAQTGTIQLEAQDDGYITISGQNYGYDNEITQVILNGQEIGSNALDEGLVVRYTLNGDGVLTRIEILGPMNMIRALEES